jgi:hypothetical protein
MEPVITTTNPPLCPSTQPEVENSVAFSIISGTVEEPHLNYLSKPHLVTEKLLARSGPVKPTEIFRFAGSCAEKACQHFDGENCRLAERIANQLPAVTEELPPCRIRSNCRWWKQEGKAACLCCPQIVTDAHNPSDAIRSIADSPSNT